MRQAFCPKNVLAVYANSVSCEDVKYSDEYALFTTLLLCKFSKYDTAFSQKSATVLVAALWQYLQLYYVWYKANATIFFFFKYGKRLINSTYKSNIHIVRNNRL